MRGTILRYMSKASLVAVIFFLALTLVLGMNQASAVAATPLPPMPNPFYGTLQVSGQAVPAGKVVVAKIHGVECGSFEVLYAGKYGSDDQGNFGPGIQRLVVSGHAGDIGATIEFYLGTIKANQTATYKSGGPDPVKLDLTVPPAPPVANAGADQTVKDTDGNGQEAVNLDGSASYDPDLNNITAWEWSEGTTALGSGKTLGHDFAVGSHTVTLKVTDSSGLTASDTTVVTVASSQSTEPPPTPEPTPTPTPNPPAPPADTQPLPAILAPTTTQDESPAVTPATEQPATPESPAAPAEEEQHNGGLNWWLIGGISAGAVFLIVLLFVMRKPTRTVSGR